ncbi:hypothetical protein GQ53DRAFT_235531 [Thozetella sp. PMI_491]|nr:hypothetical protein GQ53DRAFT_235531 [Thozetella sp. PMI_491]
MEPDLSNTITFAPHPFRTQSQSTNSLVHATSRMSSHSPAPAPSGSASTKDKRVANSTGIETTTGGEDKTIARHPSGEGTDVESQVAGRLPLGDAQSDPYGLSSRYKTATQLEEIKANTSRKRNARLSGADNGTVSSTDETANSRLGTGLAGGRLGQYMPGFTRTALQARRVQGFYEAQNETIERLLKSVEEHRAEARQEQGDDHLKYQIAVWGSFGANIVLAALQIYAAISSGSLSLFTTMADAIFDPMSNVTLIVTNRAVGHVDPSRFPSGKARLETVGNIVFCFLMTAVSFILIAFSVRELAEHGFGNDDVKSFHLPSVIAVVVAFSTKLALFFYTWSIKDKYSQIRILWQDHRNDLLINGFGILTSVGGSKLIWWVDPAGAIVLSVTVAFIWLRTAFTEFLLLVGVVANVEIQQLITYICITHSDAIRQIDTVRVYHSGPRLIAEVDIVMDPGASLMATHDVAEDLQFKLESLPDIERAYVHVDYETTHKPEHAYKKDL